jgi:CheY-like chemotaxis protein
VLVVDDNAIQCEALRVQLENWGMECVVCDSSKEALRLFGEYQKRRKPFDLFIIDSAFSNESGADLALKLSQRVKKQKGTKIAQVILLRALADDFDRDVIDKVMPGFVNKPVLASPLFDAVMSKIFDAEKRNKIDSGLVTLDGFERDKPLGQEVREKASSLPSQSPSSTDKPKSSLAGKVHVLVVEDNRVNQIVAQNLLTGAGFTSEIAQNGVEACSAVRNKEYDIVLMDCQMPEMDGFEATHLIRNWEREQGRKRIPIIALTANATKEDVQKCFDVGMDAYCSKPINPQILIRLVEEWYERKELESGR